MTGDQKERARAWYREHRQHVNRMLVDHGPQIEPSGSDAGRPELWKDIHWRWFMVGEVAGQIGVKVSD